MSATIKLKRNTQAAVEVAVLQSYEPVFATDTGALFIYDGASNVFIGGAVCGLHSEKPQSGIQRRLYYETDTNVLFVDTGSAWVSCSVEDESHIPFLSTGGHSHNGINSTKISYASLLSIPSSFTPSTHGVSVHSGVIGSHASNLSDVGTATHAQIDTALTRLVNTSGSNTGDETGSSIGTLISESSAKVTPLDTDFISISDATSSNILKKVSWANTKLTLKTYFDSVYTISNIGGVPTTRTINGKYLSANITLTPTDIGLGNVSNNAQLLASQLDTDTSLILNSDSKLASQKAIKTYTDTRLALKSDTSHTHATLYTPIAHNTAVAPHSGHEVISAKGSAGGYPSLNLNSLVVQNPASASVVSSASKIPIADSSGKLNSWLTFGSAAGTVCQGNDPRLTAASTPTVHGSTYHTGIIGDHTLNLAGVGSTTHANIDVALARLALTSGTNTGNETQTSAGSLIYGSTAKTTPVDGDAVALMDSAASNLLKKLSWANIKATLKSYLDSFYVLLSNVDNDPLLAANSASRVSTQQATRTFVNSGLATKQASIGYTPENAASKGVASGYPSLNSSILVVQNPANATASPTPNKIPIADANGRLDGWVTGGGTSSPHSLVGDSHVVAGLTEGHVLKALSAGSFGFATLTPSNVGLGNVSNAAQLTTTQLGAASGVASLNSSRLVVENPANATASPTASKIPIADTNGKLDGWITPGIPAAHTLIGELHTVANLVDGQALVASGPSSYGFRALTSSDVSLGNVSNVAQMPLSYKSTDGTLYNNSDSSVPTEKAVRTFASVFNVKSYSVPGVDISNGINDATSAINAAIAAAAAAIPRGTVFFPRGIYKTTGSHELSGMHGLKIRGEGIRASQILIDHPYNNIFQVSTLYNQLESFEMSGLTFTSVPLTNDYTNYWNDVPIGDFPGNSSSWPRTGGAAFAQYNSTLMEKFTKFEDLEIVGQYNGISIENAEMITMERIQIWGCSGPFNSLKGTWTQGVTYAPGDMVLPPSPVTSADANWGGGTVNLWYYCSKGGTAYNVPNTTIKGATFTDGTVTWDNKGTITGGSGMTWFPVKAMASFLAPWTASTLYIPGQIVASTLSSNYWYYCVSGGTSGGSIPSWTQDAVVGDGGVTWKCMPKWSGPSVGGVGIFIGLTWTAIIDQCAFFGCHTWDYSPPALEYAIMGLNAGGISITNCTFMGMRSCDIFFASDEVLSPGNPMLGDNAMGFVNQCHFDSTGGKHIFAYWMKWLTITNSHFYDAGLIPNGPGAAYPRIWETPPSPHIFIDHCNQVSISNCAFNNGEGHGLMLENSSGSVTGCTFFENGQAQVMGSNYAISITGQDSITYAGNTQLLQSWVISGCHDKGANKGLYGYSLGLSAPINAKLVVSGNYFGNGMSHTTGFVNSGNYNDTGNSP